MWLVIFPIILGTKTATVGDGLKDQQKHYLISCGGPCQSVSITLTVASGNPRIYGKIGSRPGIRVHNDHLHVDCSGCECESK